MLGWKFSKKNLLFTCNWKDWVISSFLISKPLFHHWMLLQWTSIGKKQTKQERLSFLWSPSVSMWYLRSLMEIYWGHPKVSISIFTFFIIKRYICCCFIGKVDGNSRYISMFTFVSFASMSFLNLSTYLKSADTIVLHFNFLSFDIKKTLFKSLQITCPLSF